LLSFLVGRRQVLFVGIDDEYGKQPRGLGPARVLADAMAVARQFGEAFRCDT
jgi:hypothetical protein